MDRGRRERQTVKRRSEMAFLANVGLDTLRDQLGRLEIETEGRTFVDPETKKLMANLRRQVRSGSATIHAYKMKVLGL